MGKFTGVGAILSVSHEDGQGRLHGHSYEVVAWFHDDRHDALRLQRLLASHCDALCHTVLPPELARAEDLSAHLKNLLAAYEVEVNRPLERLYARAK